MIFLLFTQSQPFLNFQTFNFYFQQTIILPLRSNSICFKQSLDSITIANMLLNKILTPFSRLSKRSFQTKWPPKPTINNLIPNQFICKSSLQPSTPKFFYSAVSMKDRKIKYDPSKKTEIISLNQEQLQQLATIPTYMTSISFLQKNDLSKSLQYLNLALNEAKVNFPESINLHMCLLNRKSILLKLLSQNEEFISTLQEIFLLGQSLKGLKNLDSQKHLRNYLLSLLFHDRQKMSCVIEYVQSLEQIVNSPKLQKKIEDFVFYDSIADLLVRNQPETGFAKLESLPDETFKQKYFKTNNLAWLKFISWKANCKTQSEFTKKIKEDAEQLLKKFLRALFEMEYCVPEKILKKNQHEIPQNSHLIGLLKGYLVENIKQLRFVPDQVKLGNPQSHIVTMNIANLLFEAERLEECVYFMKLSLSTALDLGEVERVGLCLLLLAKISFKGAQNYEQILLGMLQNSKNYPTHIIKECLSVYSQFLFKQGRYIEAENYANQMMKLMGDLNLEGLLLPDYDFSF